MKYSLPSPSIGLSNERFDAVGGGAVVKVTGTQYVWWYVRELARVLMDRVLGR